MVDVDGFVSVASSSSMQPELWCQLPAEIQYQVLLRLPVVELLRFASVCKQWRKWTTSADFRRRCLNPRAGPYLLAIRSLYDLRFAPVLSSDGSNWHGLDLTFLYNALIKKNCVQILSASSDGGLLCVGAVRAHQDPLEKYVILVCNPLTKSWKCLPQWRNETNEVVGNLLYLSLQQIFIRADKSSSSYKIYVVFNRCVVVYNSMLDAFQVLPVHRHIADVDIVWTAFVRDTYCLYCKSGYDILVHICDIESMVPKLTGFSMDYHLYKFLVYDDRLFCATVGAGDCRDADEDQYFPLEEWELSSEFPIELGCIVIYETEGWQVFDLVEHKGYILMGVYTNSDKQCRWLEVPAGIPRVESVGKCRFPALPDLVTWNATAVESFTSWKVVICNFHFDLMAEV